MSFAQHARCLGCGATYSWQTPMNLCPHDRRPLQIELDLPRLAAARPDLGWYTPSRNDMWRFGGLLALDVDDPLDRGHIVTLGEGATGERGYDDHPVARRAGFRLRIKDEGRALAGCGANPTQSFKDRGMAMVVSMARRLGLSRLAVPTQGNAGDSLCEYARAAGLEAAIVLPRDTPMPILGRIAALALLDPRVRIELVDGTIREAGARLTEQLLPLGYFSVATFQEPGWRIEGKKTLGLELAEPRPARAGGEWRLPDVIVYPTGGGTGILGMWKAFDELEALDLIDSRRPRMIVVQSEATAPLVEAYETGADDTRPVAAGRTLATGLNVPGGVGHFRVLDIVRRSGGIALAVSEAAIADALRDVYRSKGWWFGPEGAATLAALQPLVERGAIGRGDDVVAVNTGSFEKYLPALRHLL